MTRSERMQRNRKKTPAYSKDKNKPTKCLWKRPDGGYIKTKIWNNCLNEVQKANNMCEEYQENNMWTILKYWQTTWEERAKKNPGNEKYKEWSEKLTRQLQRQNGAGRRINGLEVRTRQSSESKEEEEKGWAKSKHSTGDLRQLPNLTKERDINILEAGLHSSRLS